MAFFGSPTAAVGVAPEAAERRFAEWFLLERPSERFVTPPVEALAAELASEDGLDADLIAALRRSFCGVFEVSAVVQGEGAWLRDMLLGGEYPLVDRTGSEALEVHDVLIGRLFALGAAGNWLSRSAAFFRSDELRTALARDLEAARGRRRGVPRLSQLELERLFWGAESALVTPETALGSGDAIAAAREWLAANGVGEERADGFLAELARAPFDPNRVVIGARDALGSILERLAFDTELDLERARAVLVAAWAELSNPPEDATEVHEPGRAPHRARDPQSALENFDRGREAGRDLESLFGELERDLGLEPDEDVVDDSVPDFPGVVGAMVEECIWEIGRESGDDAAKRLEPLRRFSAFGADIGVFENLAERELLAFTTVWLPECGDLRDASDARATLGALREFCAWAEDRHGVMLRTNFAARLDELAESLPRTAEANLATEPTPTGRVGSVFEVVAVGAESRVRDSNGRESTVRIAARLARSLAVGDRLRAELESNGRFVVYRCYPPQSAAILSAR